MTPLPNPKKVHVRHGHLLFTISYQPQGIKLFQVYSDSPTFQKTLGVKEFTFLTEEVPGSFIGPTGDVVANSEQLALLTSISSAINSNITPDF